MATIRKILAMQTIDLLTEGKYVNFLNKSGNFKTVIEDGRKGILNTLKVIFKIYEINMI